LRTAIESTRSDLATKADLDPTAAALGSDLAAVEMHFVKWGIGLACAVAAGRSTPTPSCPQPSVDAYAPGRRGTDGETLPEGFGDTVQVDGYAGHKRLAPRTPSGAGLLDAGADTSGIY